MRRIRGSTGPAPPAADEHLQFDGHIVHASARLPLARATGQLPGGTAKADLDAVFAELEPIAKSDGPLAKEVDAFLDQLVVLPPPVREPFGRRLEGSCGHSAASSTATWTLREIRDVQGK